MHSKRPVIRFSKDGWWRATHPAHTLPSHQSLRILLEELAGADIRKATLEWEQLPAKDTFGDATSGTPTVGQPFDAIAVNRERLKTLRQIHEQLLQAYDWLHRAALTADSDETSIPEALSAAIGELRGLAQQAHWAAGLTVQAAQQDIDERGLKLVD